MELKITITEAELELLPYVAIASKVQIDPSKSQQENAELVANALKASLIEDAVKRRVEHVAQQAAAQEAARLKDYMPKGFNNTLGY